MSRTGKSMAERLLDVVDAFCDDVGLPCDDRDRIRRAARNLRAPEIPPAILRFERFRADVQAIQSQRRHQMADRAASLADPGYGVAQS